MVMSWPLTLSPPLLFQPPRQRLHISGIHPQHDLFSVDPMNTNDVVFVKGNLVALMKFVQSSLDKRVVHDTPKPLSVTLRDSHPKVLAPSS